MIAENNSRHQSDDPFESLDFTAVSFPSDSLSIAHLRKVYPDLFDKGLHQGSNEQPKFFLNPHEPGHAEDTIGDMLYRERMIAAYAYAIARGITPPDPHIPDFKEGLVEAYIYYGIASGQHHADQLIRGIERQGAVLAKQRQP